MIDFAAIKDALKDDLGIAAGDTTADAWLERRVNGVWARMETFCLRTLAVPAASFVDDWATVVETRAHHNVPPVLAHAAVASVFLRQFPVVSIDDIELDGAPTVAADVRVEPASGKLLALHAGACPVDLSGELLNARARITYTAGFAVIPGELYETLLGCIAPLWQARKSQGELGLAGTVSAVNVVDVGSIDIAQAPSFAQTAAARPGDATADPLLGPFTALLWPFVDHRSSVGSATYPASMPAAPAPP